MAVTDPSKTSTVKADEPKPAPAGKLAPASESGDPAVHHALAVLQGAQMNRDALDVEKADIDAADQAVADAKKALADLGYE
jgi:hypothetical protein